MASVVVGMSEPSTPSPSEAAWSSKEISLEQVSDKISNGSSVYIGSTAATADAALRTMVDDIRLQNIQIIQMIPGGNLPHLSRNLDRFQTVSFFSFYTKGLFFTPQSSTTPDSSHNQQEGLQDYKPISIATIPRLLEEKRLHVDVAIIKVTKPHKGFVSLGMGVECTQDFCRHARIVIAQVNENMPWTEGPSKIPISDITWWIDCPEPLLTTEELWPEFIRQQRHQCHHPQEVLDSIGQHVMKEINDGDTLRFGVSTYMYSIFPFLSQRKDLGLHTDILPKNSFVCTRKASLPIAVKASMWAALSCHRPMVVLNSTTFWIAIPSLNSIPSVIPVIHKCWARLTISLVLSVPSRST